MASNTTVRAALGAALVAAVALTAGCAAGDVPEAPADDPVLVEGQAIFTSNCISCHGADGSGGAGPKLNEGRMVTEYPDAADEVEVVTGGRGAMPGFGEKLTAAEIEAVVAYTREVLS